MQFELSFIYGYEFIQRLVYHLSIELKGFIVLFLKTLIFDFYFLVNLSYAADADKSLSYINF